MWQMGCRKIRRYREPRVQYSITRSVEGKIQLFGNWIDLALSYSNYNLVFEPVYIAGFWPSFDLDYSGRELESN